MATRFTTTDWYSEPEWYDIIYEPDTPREVEFLERALEVYGPPRRRGRTRALEPACGSGRLVAALARRGYAVTGFDLEPEMVAYSNRRLRAAGLRARVVRSSLERFGDELRLGPPFQLAHCLVSSFKYIASDAAARAHLQAVADALAPGGLYVLGLHLTKYDETGVQRERWVGARGPVHVVCNVQSWPPDPRSRTERMRARLRVQDGARERRTETKWTWRTYSPRQMLALLATVPSLEIAAIHDFTYDIEQSWTIDELDFDTLFVLRRRP
ncbi:MAG: class I SAM-dependent methyltransferase [Myxococcales bacterium]|nr:class I SAM-dependent methyltransferase [Myxococcales bacterium]MCB9752646.1 class I SAM-dependent methyltransferase [Myxococcales bacterium]